MAKKVSGYIKLQIPAGKATPAPPVGPALGQHGVNIVEFTKQFNAKTADQGDLIIPVVITVYSDRSFSFVTKTPPAAVLPVAVPPVAAPLAAVLPAAMAQPQTAITTPGIMVLPEVDPEMGREMKTRHSENLTTTAVQNQKRHRY